MKTGKYNKIILSKKEEKFIQDNFYSMTNRELADAMGLKLTKLRMFAYSMGLKRMEMEYWTTEQVLFLKKYYKTIGDVELAEIFNERWLKNKGWTKKHIEKKRRYLKLKRTSAELKKIHKRNVLMGRFAICNIKMWEKRGISPVGEKRIWFTSLGLPYTVIKTKEGFVHYNRWLWEKEKGKVPPEMNVCQVRGDRSDPKIEDFELLTNAQLSQRNSQGRVPKEYAQALKLNREITKHLIKLKA